MGQPAASSSRFVRPFPAVARAAPRDDGWKVSDVVSEVRAGLFAHDTGPFSARKEDGVDVNLELLFRSPGFLDIIWSPRPHLGVSVNSAGDTSQAYLGLTWEYAFAGRWFVEFGFGGMVHDGHLVGIDDDGVILGKSLGCRVLFRGSLGVGYRFGERMRHAVIAHFDHSSNAGLCEKNTWDGTAGGRQDFVINEGLESAGLQYGYRF
jgi:lipid A 3-O-deacylase